MSVCLYKREKDVMMSDLLCLSYKSPHVIFIFAFHLHHPYHNILWSTICLVIEFFWLSVTGSQLVLLQLSYIFTKGMLDVSCIIFLDIDQYYSTMYLWKMLLLILNLWDLPTYVSYIRRQLLCHAIMFILWWHKITHMRRFPANLMTSGKWLMQQTHNT